MSLLSDIVDTLPEGEVLEVRIGLHWTAVAALVSGEVRCGLASTLRPAHDHRHEPDVSQAGQLESFSGKELARLALGSEGLTSSVVEEKPVESGIGLAAINALLPRRPELWREENAEDVIASLGRGKKVALVGHFPFVPSLRGRVGELKVLEQDPEEGDLPAEAAPEVIPQAEVVAITGMTITNQTLEGLLALRNPKAKVLVLGPTTPLSPVLFERGVDVLSGAVVIDVEAVMKAISQAGHFRQVHRAGVRLVNLYKEEWR